MVELSPLFIVLPILVLIFQDFEDVLGYDLLLLEEDPQNPLNELLEVHIHVYRWSMTYFMWFLG